jgi:DNA-binding transcriptional ArsR family regulator
MNIDEKSPPTLTFAKALADSTRQKIMQACCCEWCSVGELAASVDVGQPTVSHHLAILREAGLVHVREEGRQTFYSLNQDAVVSCCGRLVTAFAPERDALIRPKDIR